MRWSVIVELDSPWLSKSLDGYYAVAKSGPPFIAHHIEAVWARPMPIAECMTLELAQQACEHHSRGEPVAV